MHGKKYAGTHQNRMNWQGAAAPSFLLGAKMNSVPVSFDSGVVKSAGAATRFVLAAEKSTIAGYTREGDDLIIQATDGRTLKIVDFFKYGQDGQSLVVVDGGEPVTVDLSQALAGDDLEAAYTSMGSGAGEAGAVDSSLLTILGVLAAGGAVAGAVAASSGGGNSDDSFLYHAILSGSGQKTETSDGSETSQDDSSESKQDTASAPSFSTSDSATGTAIAAGSATNNASPTFNGTVDPGSSVILKLDGQEITVTPDGNGYWEYTAPGLADGSHDIEVSVRDPQGNASESSSISFWVDTTPPAPTSMTITDQDGAVLDSELAFGTVPTFSGTAEPGSVVVITLNGTITEIQADPVTGNWSFSEAELPSGAHSICVKVRDPAGNESPEETINFAIADECVYPVINPPVITSVIDDIAPVTGEISNGGITDDVTPLLSGTNYWPFGTINIYDNGILMGSVTADASGNWQFQVVDALSDGEHVFTARNVVDGGESPASAAWTITVDTPAAVIVPPVITSVIDDVDPVTGEVTSGGKTDDTLPTIRGTGAVSDGTVNVYIDGKLAGSAAVDAQGNWTFQVGAELSDGAHIFAAKNVVDGRESAESASWTINVETTLVGEPSLAEITILTDGVHFLRQSDATDVQTPTLHGTTTGPNTTVRIYDNGVLIGSTISDAGGKWEFTPETPFSYDNFIWHKFTAVCVDKAGNEGTPSASWNLLISSDLAIDRLSPTLTSVVDDSGLVTASISDGGTTSDTTPTLSGYTAYLTTVSVTIYDNNVLIGTVSVDDIGNWTFTPEEPLAGGVHHFTVQEIDNAGREGHGFGIGSWTVVIEADPAQPSVVEPPVITSVIDDVAPVTGEVASGGKTDDTLPTIRGTGAAADGTVNVYIDGQLAGSAAVDAQGNWTFQVGAELPDGAHIFTAKNVVDGQESAESASWTINVETSLTPEPSIDAPVIIDVIDDFGPVTGTVADGGSSDDFLPTIRGTGAVSGGVVHLYVDGVLAGSATADSAGNWQYQFVEQLHDGQHVFTAKNVVDSQESDLSNSWTVNFEVTPTPSPIVEPPVITSVIDDVDPITGEVSSGGTTDDTLPTIRGTGAVADGTVSVYIDGVLAGSAVVDAQGNWTFQVGAALSDGAHIFTAKNVVDGQESAESASWTVNVDTSLTPEPSVEAPVIVDVIDDVAPITGAVASGGTTDDTLPTIRGTGAVADGSVNVYIDGVLAGSATVDAQGNWTFQVGAELPDGAHIFTAKNVVDGQESAESASWTINVDTSRNNENPAVAEIIQMMDDAFFLTSGGITPDQTPTLRGTSSEPNMAVRIYDNGILIGTVDSGADGKWEFTPETPLAYDLYTRHSFTAACVDKDGNEGAPSASWNILITNELHVDPVTPAITSVIDDTGAIPADIGHTGITGDTTPTLYGYTAQVNSVTINIYANGRLIGTAVPDDFGKWSFTPDSPLPAGDYDFTVMDVDSAGNMGGFGGGIWTITVEGSSPAVVEPPVITEVIDDVAPVTGAISSGGTTDDTLPTIRGTGAVADGTVNVYIDGVLAGSAAVDVQGNWTFQVGAALSDGAYIFTAKNVVDGQESVESASWTINVDTSPIIVNPAVAEITIVTDDAYFLHQHDVTSDQTPTLRGTSSEPNATVRVYDNDVLIGSVAADAAGRWIFTPETPLAYNDGQFHSLVAVCVNEDGIEGVPSANWELKIFPNLARDPFSPVITSVVDDNGLPINGSTEDTTPTLSGFTAYIATAAVNIYDNGKLIGVAPTDESGHWSFTPDAPLLGGVHSFIARDVDATGNEGGFNTGDWTITIETDPDQVIVTPDTAEVLSPVDAHAGLLGGLLESASDIQDTVDDAQIVQAFSMKIADLFGDAQEQSLGKYLETGEGSTLAANLARLGNEGPLPGAHDVVKDNAMSQAFEEQVAASQFIL